MPDENNSEFERLKNEIESIRAEYESAKRILKNITDFATRFESIRGLLESADEGLEAHFNWIKSKKDEVSIISSNASTLLGEIQSNLSSIKNNIELMRESFIQFSEIKGKIDAKSNDIESLLATAQSLKIDIDTVKKDSQKILEKITTLFEKAEKQVLTMQESYEKFLQIKIQIEDKNNGLEAILVIAQELKKRSGVLFEEIKTFRDESKKLLDDIKKNKSDSDNLKENILENLKVSEEKKEDITKMAGLIIDAGFSDSFSKRAEKLSKAYRFWATVFFVAVIALAILLYLFFGKLVEVPELKFIAYRISLSSPLILLIIFALRQFENERSLNEKYAFKAVISSTIRNHTQFLIDKFEGDVNKIHEFTQLVFSVIYKEPFDDEQERKKIKEIESKLKELTKKQEGEKQMDIQEMVSVIKELKSIVTDESILDKIINLIFKK